MSHLDNTVIRSPALNNDIHITTLKAPLTCPHLCVHIQS